MSKFIPRRSVEKEIYFKQLRDANILKKAEELIKKIEDARDQSGSNYVMSQMDYELLQQVNALRIKTGLEKV